MAITPVQVSSLTLNPTTVTGGQASTGTVTLNAAAPAGGAVVSLSSSNAAAATVPVGVTIASGQTSGTFAVSTTGTGAPATATITGVDYQGGSAAAALVVNPAILITNIASGDTLTGDVDIVVQVPNTTYQHGQITLSLDGTAANACGELAFGASPPTTTAGIETAAYANGTHTLTVTDYLGNSDTRTVTFWNPIFNTAVCSYFDTTNSDGTGGPTVCDVQAELVQPQSWSVTVLDTDDPPVTVRTFAGTGSVISATWDGKDSGGVEAPDDLYQVVLLAGGVQQRHYTNKRRISRDSLVLLDKACFPAHDFEPYLRAIKQKLQRWVAAGSISPIAPILVNTHNRSATAAAVAKINAQLAVALKLVYVDAHGGFSPAGQYSPACPMFGLGYYSWHTRADSRDLSNCVFDLRLLVGPAGYGGNSDPPKVVWIDACKSAGGYISSTQQGPDDDGFQVVFQSGNQAGIFMGWNGDCEAYGARPAPPDDWSFWRNDMWTQILSGNTFAWAWARTLTEYGVHGYYFNYGERPSDRFRMWGLKSDTFQ